MVEQLKQEIDTIEFYISLLWDDKILSIEERAKKIDQLSKQRFKRVCFLQDLNLHSMGYY